jgi:hypothetical protein
MTRARMLVLGGLLIVIVGLLASGLAGIEFRGGRIPLPPPTLALGEPGGMLYLGTPEWILDAIRAVIVVALVVSVIALIVSPQARRRLLVWLAVLALVLLVLSLAEDRLRRLIPEPEPEPEPAAVLPVPPEFGALEDPEAAEPPPPPQVPDWIAIVGGAALAAAIALWVLHRFRLRLPGEEEEIREAMASASADLAQGLPVSDVVIRCWLRMVASQRARGANAPATTPRELADHLVRLGFREDAVLVLTKLFEEVRYGHKETEPRRAEALAALAAIERAYG